MKTSEFEYYLICEMITMPDRVLAQQMELLIWAKSPVPQEPILERFLQMLQDSEDGQDFWNQCRAYVDSFPVEWWISIDGKVINPKADLSTAPWFTVSVIKRS